MAEGRLAFTEDIVTTLIKEHSLRSCRGHWGRLTQTLIPPSVADIHRTRQCNLKSGWRHTQMSRCDDSKVRASAKAPQIELIFG